MSKTISGTFTSTYKLTSTASNPVTLTSTAKLTPSGISGGYGGLYGKGGSGQTWTITNAGVINDGMNGNGIQLGQGGTYVGASVITNQSGGTIVGAYGIRMYNTAASSITNLSGGTIEATSNRGVYFDAASTLTNSGVILAPTLNSQQLGVLMENGGVIVNNAGGTIAGYDGVVMIGTSTVTNAGTIEAAKTSAFALELGSASNSKLIVDPGAVFLGQVFGGYATLELASAASASTLTATSFEHFNSVKFDSGSQWTLIGAAPSAINTSAVLNGIIQGFTSTDTIDLTGFYATSASYAGGNLTLTNSINAHTTLHFSGGPFNIGTPHITTNASGTVLTILCYVAGTNIATPSGEVPVQRLAIGDMVLTQRGEAKPIAWIGKGKALATRGQRSAATPVIVRKGALADNVPHRDLHLTKGHSLYLDGALIPVEFLVNHRSIVWDDRAQEVEIYHIELAAHDVLLAEGAPTESYRDDGNRWLFQNANSGWDQEPKQPCGPVLTGGPVVDAVWKRLLDRAGLRPGLPLTDDPDLHVLIDGKRVDAATRAGDAYIFDVRVVPGDIRLMSSAAVPQEIGIARDPRCLGVAVRRIIVRQGTRFRTFDADNDLLSQGFHAFERDNDWRWTDGDAILPSQMFASFRGPIALVVQLGGSMQYICGTSAVHAA